MARGRDISDLISKIFSTEKMTKKKTRNDDKNDVFMHSIISFVFTRSLSRRQRFFSLMVHVIQHHEKGCLFFDDHRRRQWWHIQRRRLYLPLSLTLFNTIFYLDDAANGQKASMVITYSTFAKRNRAPSSTIFVILSVTISSFK